VAAETAEEYQWKAEALGIVAEAAASIGDKAQVAALLQQALQAVERMEGSVSKLQRLEDIVAVAAKIGDRTRVTPLLQRAVEVAEGINESSSSGHGSWSHS